MKNIKTTIFGAITSVSALISGAALYVTAHPEILASVPPKDAAIIAGVAGVIAAASHVTQGAVAADASSGTTTQPDLK